MKEASKYKYHKNNTLIASKIPYSIGSRPNEINICTIKINQQ